MPFAYEQPEVDARSGAPAVVWIIGLAVAIAFLQATLTGDALMNKWLGYHATDLGDRRVWTIVTYMFVHGGFLHLAFNMYMLWLFGRRVEQAWGSTTFTWFYLWAGVSGWAFHWMFTPNSGVLVGASAAVLGVAVAYASRWPNEELYLFGIVPMKVRWLVIFLAVLSFVMVILNVGKTGGTAYAAHLGGMFGAWLYLRTPNAQSIDRIRSRIAPVPDYGDETPRAVPRHSSRPRSREPENDDIVAKSRAAVASNRTGAPAVQVTGVTPASRAALDMLLDKIAAHGIKSLSDHERELLEDMSRKLRDNT